ncbi:MAG TPA: hypothetical protein VNP04_13670 [Alphaproteobacteria bacterium]|nr:hypothetical protein [Alphaproteobacteria bacterium]
MPAFSSARIEAIGAMVTLSALQQSGPVSLAAVVRFTVSGVSAINPIGLRPLNVSAEWLVINGTAPFTYHWSFEYPSSVSTVSAITRNFSGASGLQGLVRVSAAIGDDLSGSASEASSARIVTAFFVHLRQATMPNVWDGMVVYESQHRARVWPT